MGGHQALGTNLILLILYFHRNPTMKHHNPKAQ